MPVARVVGLEDASYSAAPFMCRYSALTPAYEKRKVSLGSRSALGGGTTNTKCSSAVPLP
jgi:hypothetical protein